MPAPITQWMGTTPKQLRYEIQNDRSRNMQLRRATAAVSLLGIGLMALTTLLQLGLVDNLPDPPLRNFKTKKVNSSDEAYSYGGPDSPINIVAHGFNLVLASTGHPDRSRRTPWLPLLAFFAEVPQAIVAAKYLFHQMPRVDKAWCPYCILDALTHFATLALLTPEAADSAQTLRSTQQKRFARILPRAEKAIARLTAP